VREKNTQNSRVKIPMSSTKRLKSTASAVAYGTRVPKVSRKAQKISVPSARPNVRGRSNVFDTSAAKVGDESSVDTMLKHLSFGENAQVKEIQPAYKSSSNVSLLHPELALYGKDLNVQKAVLEKEIFDINLDDQPSKLVQVFAPKRLVSKKKTRKYATEKYAFKSKDIKKQRKITKKVIINTNKWNLTQANYSIMNNSPRLFPDDEALPRRRVYDRGRGGCLPSSLRRLRTRIRP